MRRVFGVVPQVVVLAGLLLAVVLPVGALAVPKALLSTVGGGTAGHGGVFNGARGIAANHSTGDFYVADGASNRVQQFTADGAFVRAWGFDVDSSSPGTGFEVCTVATQCKAGVTGGASGQVAQPTGIAVDQSNGFVYVTSITNRRVDVFSGSGQFAGAFGWDVDPAGVVGFEICTTSCKAAGAAGVDAGRFSNLIASNPAVDPSAAPGTVYVSDQGNLRVAKFTTTISSGTLQSASFVKAFGWDVAPGAVNEEQEIRVRATGGQFTLTYGPDATANLAYNATAGDVETALNALPSINTGGGAVTVTGGPGDATGSNLYVVRFTVGPLAGTDATQLTAANGTTPLSGGNPSSGALVQTRANGGTTTGFESCTTASGCKVGVGTGSGPGQFPTGGAPSGTAVDSTGSVYVVSGPFQAAGNDCSATASCRIQKFNPSTTAATTDFGPASGDGTITNTTSLDAGTVAGLDVAIDPSNDHVFVNLKSPPTPAPAGSTSTSYQVREYTPAGSLVETHPPSTLTSATATANHGLAVGTDGRVYSNMTTTSVYILGPVPDPTPVMGLVTNVGSTTATFNGTVEIPPPGSPTFNTTYRFEYSSNGIDWTRVPVPDANVTPATTGVQPVSQTVSGLQPSTLYQVRLVASTGNAPVVSQTTTVFQTDAVAPRVAWTFVDEVTKTEARLGAHIDPEGLPTTYHFEWGTQQCSNDPNPCTEVPAFERGIGDGNKVVIVNDPIDGLEKESHYYYRVVATNSEATTYGPDQTFETLNDCNLTDGRCYELVSPPDKGAAGAVGDTAILGDQMKFQVARDGSAVEYLMAYGAADATSGSEPTYVARRGGAGWASRQLSSPATAVSDGPAGWAAPDYVTAMSENLGCAAVVSVFPMGDDPPLAALQDGNTVLYLTDGFGGWTPITTTVPTGGFGGTTPNRDKGSVVGIGSSELGSGCGRIVFHSQYQYGNEVQGAGAHWLYRWDGSGLEYVGVVPGPGGPEVVEVIAGASYTRANDATGLNPNVGANNYSNAVSGDGSRVFFTAVSRLGGNAGQQSVFMREYGSEVAVDVGQSQTGALPGGVVANDDDSLYWTASEDGSEVFFTGRYKLASNDDGTAVYSSDGPAACNDVDGTGCDLYRYSLETGKLTDLSADVDPSVDNANGASVVGVLGASDDGDYVYFAARGQLEAGEGKTEANNLANDTYNIYLAHDGDIHYVGQAGEDDTKTAGDPNTYASSLLLWGHSSDGTGPGQVTSRVARDSGHLLYETAQNVTGYVSGGENEAYLYDPARDETVCVSCRRDGQPEIPPPVGVSAGGDVDGVYVPLSNGADANNPLNPPLTLTDDGRRVLFLSQSRLATGGVEGRLGLYQWEEGQVSFVASSVQRSAGNRTVRFAGASSDGDEVFFTTVDHFTWQDFDAKGDLYVAKVGGGIDQPDLGPEPCDPLTEEACSDEGAGGVGSDVGTTGPGADAPAGSRAVLRLGRLSSGQLSRLAKGRRVDLAVRVSRPGLVSVRGTASVGGLSARVISADRQATQAGVVRVPVVLSRAARKRLVSAGRLRVGLVVRLEGATRRVASTLVFKTPNASKRKAQGKPPARSGRVVGIESDEQETGR